ncbi:PREDICTED: postacrosomal sheath WW domain-binding protein isoform X1 [Ceratotherium simum simum]|uniref:Postacrosomal sheath WW domain-binding protein isoform X1 n=1 Tax=Ceratotherium simum simum TaxID=73337 RepID=A0ABM1DAL4_CERSS|nr:PREDICTED: postacrosomal sheath WW domain-binding protein isoform X1 [Ceratotherium simum simum]
MAVNQSHTESRRGAVIPFGESVLQQCQDVDLSFPQQPGGSNLFSGTKRGTLFLTSYRVIFVTSHSVSDPMFSFMMPFDLMSNCTVEQPVFAANYIKGIIRAAPDAARGVPLRSINYWFGAPGLYVVTGQGSMVCTQRMPCPAYPVVVYGPPPEGYRAPPEGYGAPPPGYGAPPAGYGAPPVGYGAPPVGYVAPPAGYGAPPVEYGAPSAGYGALPSGNEAPPPRDETAPAGNRAESHKSVAAQPAGSLASLPSASSSQAHLLPSKK